MPENYCNSQCKTVWDEARQEAKSWFDYKCMACTILMILSLFFFLTSSREMTSYSDGDMTAGE